METILESLNFFNLNLYHFLGDVIYRLMARSHYLRDPKFLDRVGATSNLLTQTNTELVSFMRTCFRSHI